MNLLVNDYAWEIVSVCKHFDGTLDLVARCNFAEPASSTKIGEVVMTYDIHIYPRWRELSVSGTSFDQALTLATIEAQRIEREET